MSVLGVESSVAPQDSTALIPGLPNEIASQCLIRIPRKHHRRICYVSKSWLAFMRSRDFYSMRRDQSLAEKWMYVLSRDKTTEVQTWHSFDPQTSVWRTLPPMPPECQRAYGLACASCCGNLYVMGGAGWFTSSKSDVFRYDPILNSWDPVSMLNSARCYALSSVLEDRIYVVGGMGSTTSGLLKSVEIYDPEKNKWSYVDDFPIESDLEDCVAYKGRLFVRTIAHINHPHYVGSAFCYDPSIRQWSSDLNALAKEWVGSCTVYNERLYMIQNHRAIKLMVFDEKSSSWSVMGKLCSKLMPPLRLLAMDGKLFVVGRGGNMTVIDIDLLERRSSAIVAKNVDGFGDSLTDMVFGCYALAV